MHEYVLPRHTLWNGRPLVPAMKVQYHLVESTSPPGQTPSKIQQNEPIKEKKNKSGQKAKSNSLAGTHKKDFRMKQVNKNDLTGSTPALETGLYATVCSAEHALEAVLFCSR